MSRPKPLRPAQYYHIFNRGNNAENLFRDARNYPYFLELYARYIEPVAETFAYCLMPNHFHLLVRIKDLQSSEDCQSCLEDDRSSAASRAFADLFATYTKALNKAHGRTGSLFEKPFHRLWVDSDRYFASLVAYIHLNPQKHGFIDDFRRWQHSSYRACLSDQPTRIQREVVLDWFGGRAGFEAFHCGAFSEAVLEPLIADDFA